MSVNVYEQSLFNEAKRNSTLAEIINRYNAIVLETESDPSLRIEFEAKWFAAILDRGWSSVSIEDLKNADSHLIRLVSVAFARKGRQKVKDKAQFC